MRDLDARATVSAMTQERRGRLGREAADRRSAESLGVPRYDELTPGGASGGCGYRILEVGERQLQRFLNHSVVDSRNAEDIEQRRDDSPGFGRACLSSDQVVDGRDGVCSQMFPVLLKARLLEGSPEGTQDRGFASCWRMGFCDRSKIGLDHRRYGDASLPGIALRACDYAAIHTRFHKNDTCSIWCPLPHGRGSEGRYDHGGCVILLRA
jgi:hypothetical protein